MTRFLSAALAAAFLFTTSGAARADDKDAKAILDKAIKALGGEEKLGKVEAFSWKSKGTITFNGNENETNGLMTIKGLDHYRREFEQRSIPHQPWSSPATRAGASSAKTPRNSTRRVWPTRSAPSTCRSSRSRWSPLKGKDSSSRPPARKRSTTSRPSASR